MRFLPLLNSLRRHAADSFGAHSPMTRAVLLYTLIALCAATVVDASTVSGGRSFSVKPVPPWTHTVAAGDEGAGAPEAGAASWFLLDDHQTRVGANRTERFYHHVKKVLTPAGLEDESELQLEFEPSYQELIIHYVLIRRGGRTINALNPKEIKVIQQEDELNQRLYNGRLSALVFLNDIRVGDVIDCAYSVNGDNPVMNGLFSDYFYLADGVPIEKLRHRLVWNAGANRALHLRKQNTDLEPQTTSTGEGTEYVWERRRVPALDYEDGTPDWFTPAPIVHLSEFAGWGDVVNWALPLYRFDGQMPKGLVEKLDGWRAEHRSPEGRLFAALRFVQDEVRYLGIELGTYSHQPSQPSKVFARRFGDCKDKSFLLAAMLGALGVEAHLALVNTEAGSTLDNWQPSPYAFDHVIVRASLAGRTLWLDPTISHQRGGLAQYYPPGYERALVLREGSGALEEMESAKNDRPTTIVSEVYSVRDDDEASAAFEVTTTYRGPDADSMRYGLARQSRADLGKTYLNYYAERDAGLLADGLPEVSDDEASNTIVVRERYTIPNFWQEWKRDFFADRLAREIEKPSVSQRRSPLALSHPKHVSQTIEIRLPEFVSIPVRRDTISDNFVRFDYNHERKGGAVKLHYTLRTLKDHVPAADVKNHLATVNRIQNTLGFELTQGIDLAGSLGGRLVGGVLLRILSLLLTGGIVAAVIIGWLIVKRRRRQQWPPQLLSSRPEVSPAAPPGATPSTSIRVHGDDELLERIKSLKSFCGELFYRPDRPPRQEAFTYDGERKILVRLRCEACHDVRDVYFTKSDGTQPAGAAVGG